jgi:hypothetical protein
MSHHVQVEVEVTPSPSAFPRVVAYLHARGLRIERVRLVGRHCSVSVVGSANAERVIALLERLVDVQSATAARADLPTRSVVTRQVWREAPQLTSHPWSRPLPDPSRLCPSPPL